MKLQAPPHHLIFSVVLSLSLSLSLTPLHALQFQTLTAIHRRILHQPLFPDSSSPPPDTPSPPIPPPPPPDTSSDQPFFHELPSGSTPDQTQPAPLPSNATTVQNPQAPQPTKGTKKVAIAALVGIVTLGMLSGFAFFLYRHRVKHPSESQKLVNGGGPGSQRFADDPSVPPSNFLYIGTVEPSHTSTTSSEAVSGPTTVELNRSPYHRLNSVKRSDRYRPSPELQPLPPLTKPPQNLNSPSAMSSSDEESNETAFHSPNCSSISYDDSYYTPKQSSNNGVANCAPIHVASSIPHSKRTSPKSRLSVSSTTRNHAAPSPPQPPPPPPMQIQTQTHDAQQGAPSFSNKRPKFSSPPPPPPNLVRVSRAPVPPPPPPPPSRPTILRQVGDSERVVSARPAQAPAKPQPQSSFAAIPKGPFENGTRKPAERFVDESLASSESFENEDSGGAKPKLKPLHWDKVRATSDRATVWDQLKSSSFQLNEDMMETLFGCNPANSVPKETTRRSVLPPVEQENRVLDPKKSQNIAILLRALNVARDEVTEALLDGNPEGLGTELLETLVKMAPTKEEEIKLRDYKGDVSKLGTAERFLKAVLDIPFAFKRVEAMLYRANFDTEVKYLRKSFQTLEEASEELKSSRLFLKLLEAVLKTGNRMNVGTNRGDAKSFKLDTLLKLVDVKATDGKTTLLHFVVQEIIKSEGEVVDSTNENAKNMPVNTKEDGFRKQGLQMVAGLGRDLSNVKKAAGMDSDVLSSYVSKLEMGLQKVKQVLQYEKPDMQGKFFNSMKVFLKEAEDEILRVKADERKALILVKEVTEYFHGDTTKEEAHPFRIFMIVRDFLTVLDQVCKEVGMLQDRTLVGSARSFRITSTAPLPVLNRYNVRQDNSSDDESLSP
ncbi:hypothetical protein ACFX13_019159 [Malus domestica]|uniref:Formin-like protein n=1 Tax=Malus domestica TaxID=3750 RepID=A0A498I0K6_MALDO|nr:hypothetical protein DVH24_030156 [Malus domestica]